MSHNYNKIETLRISQQNLQVAIRYHRQSVYDNLVYYFLIYFHNTCTSSCFQELDFDDCYLTSININTFAGLEQSLADLDLRGNQINYIQPQTFQNFSVLEQV